MILSDEASISEFVTELQVDNGVLISIILSFMMALFAIILSLFTMVSKSPNKDIDEFLKDSDSDNLVGKSFLISLKATDSIFGQRLISFRSFCASAVLSFFVFGTSYAIAYFTTPWIRAFTPALVMETFGSGVLNRFSFGFFVVVVITIISEYFYVTKTRFVLKRVCIQHSSIPTVFITCLFDIVTTYALLIFITAFLCEMCALISTIIIFGFKKMNSEILFVGDAKVAYMCVKKGTLSNITTYSLGLKHIFTFNFSSFYYLIVDIIKVISLEIKNYLKPYYFMQVYVVDKDKGLIQSISFIPLTTLFSTAFFTTIWVSISTVVIIIMKALSKIEYIFAKGFVGIMSNPKNMLRILCWMFVACIIMFSYLVIWRPV